MDEPTSLESLRKEPVNGWDSIHDLLDRVARGRGSTAGNGLNVWEEAARGVGFVTFAYDIDGVSLEITKYATCLERLFQRRGTQVAIHCIAGTFTDGADIALKTGWRRLRLRDADGWDKWQRGKWFAKLFHQDLREGSAASQELAREIWRQALDLAEALQRYVVEHEIGLLFVVNVNSNPGNVALAIAVVLVSELLGCPVLNNNHDFYWEGGRPPGERPADEPPGPRDHFFRNQDNRPFFRLLQRIFPWNGARWTQVNINAPQCRRLIDEFSFARDRVFLVGTGIDDSFFRPWTAQERRTHRKRMGRILADGLEPLTSVSVETFVSDLGSWMGNQRPVLLGAVDGLPLDFSGDSAVCFLQPTRVIGRKKIWRDWELIGALLEHEPFRRELENRPDMTLTLHCTGPVPIEHRSDLEQVVNAYRAAMSGVPDLLARRLFQSFSVGTEDHPSLHEDGLGALDIAGLYKMANVVLFPSQTEGRGLPIPESAAVGVPIVCSRYEPASVFAAVVGEDLPEDQRIRYKLFPEGEFGEDLLACMSRMILNPASLDDQRRRNREAVRQRYSFSVLERALETFLESLDSTVKT